MLVTRLLSSALLLLQPLLAHAQSIDASAQVGKVKNFDWTITWGKHAPDGFSRDMFLINGKFPGPTLEVNQDDSVSVKITNRSPFETTIHFHGIEMKGTPWSDGVPGVTQLAIKPGKSFTHKFEAAQYGSYWYHSHYDGHIEDGLYGPILIHPRAKDQKPFRLVSNDPKTIKAMEKAERNVTPLVLSDFVHLTSTQKWDMTVASAIELTCYDSILFNGKGRVDCLDPKVVANSLTEQHKALLAVVPGSSMTDKSCLPADNLNILGDGTGKVDKILPGTFSGCSATKGSIEKINIPKPSKNTWVAMDIIGALNFINGAFSIDEHDMVVYAMDGHYIEPQTVQSLIVKNGDRYSIMFKPKPGDYKIRLSSVAPTQVLTGHAILSVKGKSDGHKSKPFVDIVGQPLSKDVKVFNEMVAAPFPPSPVSQTSDAFYRLDMKIDGATYLWALNNSRLIPGDLEHRNPPILFHPDPNVQDNVTITTKYNSWVDLVFYATVFPMPPHPIHKHGNKMYHIGSGNGEWKWDSIEEAIKEVPQSFNLVNPPIRDAFASPPADTDRAWTAVRYHVDNPGPWLLHCHIHNHMAGGMMMVIQDGLDAGWPQIPKEFQL